MKRVFLDSNILIYAYDSKFPGKRRLAQEAIASLTHPTYWPCLSTQVMQEFYNTLIRKLGYTPEEGAAELKTLMALDTVIITPDLILAATSLHASGSLSFWDSLIITAAQVRQCTELWTEDLQDGQRFGTLEVVNPLLRR